MKRNEIIDKLGHKIGSLLAEAGQEAGFSVWPAPVFSPVEGELYVSPYLLPSFYDCVSELEKQGYSNKKIAKLLKNPARIAQLIWPFHTLKLTGLSEEERVKIVLKTIDLISVFREDPFCDDGKNILWSNDKIEKYLKELNWVDLNKLDNAENYRKISGKLNGSLWLLCELLYFDYHGAGHEFHGPYEIENDQMLIIREFYDLKLDHFPFSKDLPFGNITIFEIYPKKEVAFDLFNRTRSSTPLSKYLQKFYIEANGKEIKSISDISDIVESVEGVIDNGAEFVSKLGRKELLKKFGESYFFTIKPLQEELGKDSHLPKLFYEGIEKGVKEEIIKGALAGFEETEKLPPDEFVKVIAQLFDPRGD